MEEIIGRVICIEDKKIENCELATDKVRVIIEVDNDFYTTTEYLTEPTKHPNRFKMRKVSIKVVE